MQHGHCFSVGDYCVREMIKLCTLYQRKSDTSYTKQ